MKELVEKADKGLVYKEYGMTPHGIASDVQAIKHWLIKQPHLPIIRGELLNVDVDEWLENYLISCKNSVERVKENLDMYFTSKILLPEVFTCRDPTQLAFRTNAEAMRMGIIPGRTRRGRRVFIFSHSKPTADNFDPIVTMKRLTMMMDVFLQEGIDFLSLEVIIDSKNICFGHLARYNLGICKKLADIGLKALPQRISKIHVVNPTSLVETGMSLFKPLLPKKLQDRIMVHKELESLLDTIEGSALPTDFGGSGPSLGELNEDWLMKLLEYRAWFQSHDSVKSDESKRVGKCRYQSADSTAFGSQGSFRKIEVD